MIQYIYVSSSVNPFSKEELLALLASARENNERLGVTGMLVYKDGVFMQALEGDEMSIRWLSAKIAKDPRHKNIVCLADRPLTEREFPDWSMGFCNLDDIDPREVPGYTTFMDSPISAKNFTKTPALAHAFLLLFKSTRRAFNKPAPRDCDHCFG
jgi:Sensors of blue-light using FAD